LRLKVFRNKPFVIGKNPFEQTALYPSIDEFAQQLTGAITFPTTFQGERQRHAWERLISYIEFSDSPSAFNKAAAYAEGYAHALVDSGQINISPDRDLLIIATVDAWRCTRTYSNT